MLQSNFTSCLLTVCSLVGLASKAGWFLNFFFSFSLIIWLHRVRIHRLPSAGYFPRPMEIGKMVSQWLSSSNYLLDRNLFFFLTGSRFRHWYSQCTGDILTWEVTRHGPSLSTFTRPEQKTPANTDTSTETRETESAPKIFGGWEDGSVVKF